MTARSPLKDHDNSAGLFGIAWSWPAARQGSHMRKFRQAATYHPVQILLHWLIAGLIVVQYSTGGSILRTHNAVMMGMEPDAGDLLLHAIHNRSGMAILLLMLARLALRVFRGVPALDNHGDWRMHVAYTLHWAFYVLVIAQALIGLTASYVYWPVAPLHAFGAKLLLGMIGLHVLAAFSHQFITRDQTLTRMLFRRGAWSRSVTQRGLPVGSTQSRPVDLT